MNDLRMVFVVQAENAVYIFTNHEAALACRRVLKLRSDALRGCVIFDQWPLGDKQ